LPDLALTVLLVKKRITSLPACRRSSVMAVGSFSVDKQKTRDYPGACRFRLRTLALFFGAFLQVVIVGVVENHRLTGGANIHNIGFAAYYLNHFFHGCFRELFTAAAAFFHRLFLLRMMGLTLGLMVIVALSPISG